MRRALGLSPGAKYVPVLSWRLNAVGTRAQSRHSICNVRALPNRVLCEWDWVPRAPHDRYP